MADTLVYSDSFLAECGEPVAEVPFGSGWTDTTLAESYQGWMNTPQRLTGEPLDWRSFQPYVPDSDDGKVAFSTVSVSGSIGKGYPTVTKTLLRQFTFGPIGDILMSHLFRLAVAMNVRCMGSLSCEDVPWYPDHTGDRVCVALLSRLMVFRGQTTVYMSSFVATPVEGANFYGLVFHHDELSGHSVRIGSYPAGTVIPGDIIAYQVGLEAINYTGTHPGKDYDYTFDVEFGSLSSQRQGPNATQNNPCTPFTYWMDLPPLLIGGSGSKFTKAMRPTRSALRIQHPPVPPTGDFFGEEILG